MLKFNFELAKDVDDLDEACRQHLNNALLNMLKGVSATFYLKTQNLERVLEIKRMKRFKSYENRIALKMQRKVRKHMNSFKQRLHIIEQKKLQNCTAFSSFLNQLSFKPQQK